MSHYDPQEDREDGRGKNGNDDDDDDDANKQEIKFQFTQREYTFFKLGYTSFQMISLFYYEAKTNERDQLYPEYLTIANNMIPYLWTLHEMDEQKTKDALVAMEALPQDFDEKAKRKWIANIKMAAMLGHEVYQEWKKDREQFRIMISENQTIKDLLQVWGHQALWNEGQQMEKNNKTTNSNNYCTLNRSFPLITCCCEGQSSPIITDREWKIVSDLLYAKAVWPKNQGPMTTYEYFVGSFFPLRPFVRNFLIQHQIDVKIDTKIMEGKSHYFVIYDWMVRFF